MRRTYVLPLLLAVLATSAAAWLPAARKGVRAVIVHGSGLQSPIRFGDAGQASELHSSFVRILQTAPLDTDRESFRNRPCLGFAAYSAKWQFMTVDDLAPTDADWKLWYYPAANGRPATLFNGAIVPDDVAAAWTRAGIPTVATSAMKPPCTFH